MPIYDEDSTTRHQIGKVYDNDATANHQIGKVYDNDGTANHLIYTAEDVVLNGNDYGTAITGGWSKYVSTNGAYQKGTLNNSGIYLAATSNLLKNLWTNNTIDFSKYSKMNVTYTVNASAADGTAARNFAVVAKSSVDFLWQNGLSAAEYTSKQWFTHNPSTGTFTKEINVSGWTGKMHLGVIAECANTNTLTVTVKKITLE